MSGSGVIVANGQVGLIGTRGSLAQAGKYFVATNPTPGTAIAYALKTSYSATANGLFSISNGNPAGSGTNLYLDFVEITQTATVPTGCLVMRFECIVEQAVTALTTAVNATALVPVNVNSGSNTASQATFTYFTTGAGTVPTAVASRRTVGIAALPTSVAVANSTYGIQFSSLANVGPESNGAGLTAAAATAPNRLYTSMPACVLGPQTTAFIQMWWITAAANTPSFEFTVGWAEA